MENIEITKDNLAALSVMGLRELCRKEFGGAAWIASARKKVLTTALETGMPPEGGVEVKVKTSDFDKTAFKAELEPSIKSIISETLVGYLSRFEDADLTQVNVNTAIRSEIEILGLDLKAVANRVDDSMKRTENQTQTQIDSAVKKLMGHVDNSKTEFAGMVEKQIEEQVERMGEAITIKVQKKLVKEIRVVLPDGTKVEAGVQHKQFHELLTVISAGVHPFIVGPAGSGKTKVAEEVAKVLGLEFLPQSFNAQTPSSQLFGYMDAMGNYVSTVFRKAFEFGGLWLADEIDRGSGNVLTGLNAGLGNGYCSFPDKVVKRHEKFVCIASANTYGRGADRMYVGANQLDEATLNRFVQMEWEYDEELERILTANNDWCDRVQAIRKSVMAEKIRHIVSPRASFDGAKLLAQGMKKSRVEDLCIWRGMDEATQKKVLATVPKQGLLVRVEV